MQILLMTSSSMRRRTLGAAPVATLALARKAEEWAACGATAVSHNPRGTADVSSETTMIECLNCSPVAATAELAHAEVAHADGERMGDGSPVDTVVAAVGITDIAHVFTVPFLAGNSVDTVTSSPSRNASSSVESVASQGEADLSAAAGVDPNSET